MILITGYPYVRERYFATFRQWPERNAVRFLLPNIWTAKGGAVVFYPPHDAAVSVTPAWFHHSDVPVIGGLLKGWMPLFPLCLWRMRRDIRLVYACSEPALLSTFWFALFSKLLGKKFVCFTWENIPYQDASKGRWAWLHEGIVRLNLSLSDGLICGNQEAADIHRTYTRIPIEVIPMNGLDPDVFVRRQERLTNLASHVVFAFVGAIGYRKGIHVAIQALRKVIGALPNAHLIIAGAGEYEKQIDHLIDEAGVRDHVTRLPWIEQRELIHILSAADVFVYPSIPHGGWAEQFGYSMAEASLLELPVISTRSGSIADIVIDGTTGILVPPDDADALADAMLRLGTDETLRSQIGKAGRKYVSEHFSHRAVAVHLERFLHARLD